MSKTRSWNKMDENYLEFRHSHGCRSLLINPPTIASRKTKFCAHLLVLTIWQILRHLMRRSGDRLDFEPVISDVLQATLSPIQRSTQDTTIKLPTPRPNQFRQPFGCVDGNPPVLKNLWHFNVDIFENFVCVKSLKEKGKTSRFKPDRSPKPLFRI